MTQHTQKLESRLIKGKEQKYITNESFPLCFFLLLIRKKKNSNKKAYQSIY